MVLIKPWKSICGEQSEREKPYLTGSEAHQAVIYIGLVIIIAQSTPYYLTSSTGNNAFPTTITSAPNSVPTYLLRRDNNVS